MKRLAIDIDFDEIREKRAEARRALIERHGWPETVNCARCGDNGTPPDERGYCTCAAGERLSYQKARAEDWRMRVPRRCWDFTLDSAPDSGAADRVKQWLAEKPISNGVNLVLAGEPGTGKTGLAVGALKTVHDASTFTVGMINVPDYLDALRPSDDPDQRTKGDLLRKRAERCSLLVVDDLGADKPSEWVTEQIYHVVNTRYESGKPMIVTTNLTRKELAAAYGNRVIDRIVERSVLINMDGPNLRRANDGSRNR